MDGQLVAINRLQVRHIGGGNMNVSAGHDLERFLAAQASSYKTALAEIKRGAKRSHWMWYIFPQITGLGTSAVAQLYAIRSMNEARAYLDHPLLGARLRACVEALQDLSPTTAENVFGRIDAMKLSSSLTLFIAAGGGNIFRATLQRWFHGQLDEATLERLRHSDPCDALGNSCRHVETDIDQ